MADGPSRTAKEADPPAERQEGRRETETPRSAEPTTLQQASDLTSRDNSRLVTEARFGAGERAETPAGAPRGLSPEATTAGAEALTRARTRDEILAVVEGKSSGERQGILDTYRQTNKTDFVSDLSRRGLSEEDRTAVMTALRRPDGVPDTAGAIDRNLTAIREGQRTFPNPETGMEQSRPDRPQIEQRSERNIRESLSVLSSGELRDLDARMRQAPDGKGLGETLLNNPALSEGTRRAIELQLYGETRPGGSPTEGREFRGSDYRAAHPEVSLALAGNALQQRDATMFQEAMRNASPEARSRFAAPDADGKTGDQRLAATFQGEDLARSREFLQNGGASLQSLITANDRQFLFWRQQGGIDVALRNARPEDVDSYRRGEDLSRRTDQTTPLNEQQQRDLEFSRSVNERLRAADSDPRVLAQRQDLLLNREPTFASTFAGAQNANDRFRTIENMSEEQRQQIAQNPALRAQVERTVDSLAPGDEGRRMRELLDRRVSAPSEEAARNVGRSAGEVMRDNAPPQYRPAEVLSALSRMGGDGGKEYREMTPEARRQFDESVRNYMQQNDPTGMRMGFGATADHSRETNLAQRMLERAGRGEDPLSSPIDRISFQAQQATNGNNRPDGQGIMRPSNPEAARGLSREIEKTLSEDPALRERVRANPNSQEARDLSFALRVEAGAASPPLAMHEYGPMVNRLMRDGRLNLDDKVRLGQSNEDRYRTVAERSTPEERAMLLQANPSGEARRLQDSVFGNFNGDQREVLTNALRNGGTLSAADKVRLAVVDGNVTPENMRTIMRGQDAAAVKSEYARNYRSDMDSAVLGRATDGNRLQVQETLSTAPVTAGDQFLARQRQASERGGGLFFGSTGDTANIEAGRTNLARILERSSAEGTNPNSPEFQQRVQAMDRAVTQYDTDANRTREMLDTAIQTTIQVGIVASAAMTDGLTLPIGLALAGGAMHAGMSGAKDPWGMAREFVRGTVNNGLMAIPGSQVGAMLRVGETAAQTTAARFAGNAVLREGSQTELATGLRSIAADTVQGGRVTAGPEQFQALARGVARPGATEAEVAGLGRQLSQQFQADVNRGAADYFTASARAYEATRLGGGTGLASGTVSGALDWNPQQSVGDNMKRVAGSVAASAAEGTAVVFGFGEAAVGLRGVFRRGADGGLNVRAEGPSGQNLEVVRTGQDGRQTVERLAPGSETRVNPSDVVRPATAAARPTRPANEQLPGLELTDNNRVIAGERRPTDRPPQERPAQERPLERAREGGVERTEPRTTPTFEESLTPQQRAHIEAEAQIQRQRKLEFPPVTPEQHVSIANRLYEQHTANGVTRGNPPVMDLVIGPTGSGKSSKIANPIIERERPLLIDSDQIKPHVPGYRDLHDADAAHPHSQHILNHILDRAMQNGDNIVLPKVGGTVESLQPIIDAARARGYQVRLHLGEVTPDEAARRTYNRAFDQSGQLKPDGQWVHPELAYNSATRPTVNPNDSPSKSRNTFDELVRRGLVDEWSRYDLMGPRDQPAPRVEHGRGRRAA